MRGLRVVELAGSLAGAYCGRLFAGSGADVVLLEPATGAPLRQRGPWLSPEGGDEPPRSASHEYLDAAKRSVVLAGDDEVDATLKWADLVISSCDGDVEGAGRLWQRIAGLNPRAVHVVVSGFGLTGPCAGWKHSDLVDWASGGHLFITGDPRREPVAGGGPWDSYLAGATAAVGAQAAVVDSARTGRGQLVDVGAMEAVASLHQWSLTMYTHTGVVKQRWGHRFGESHHPMALYRCRDGWICIGAATGEQWENLCITTEQVELLADEELFAPAARFERADEIDERLQPWLEQRSTEEAVEQLQAARVPASRVLSFNQVLDVDQLRERRFWSERADVAPGAKMPSVPFRVGPVDRLAPAPQLGAHTEAFLAELSGGAERSPLPRLDLRDVTMVEFSVAWAGPLAGRFMADLGVEVVKVEHPTSRGLGVTGGDERAAKDWTWGTLPDPQIRAGVFPHAEPRERWWNRMGIWNKMNRNKKSLCLDVKAPGGMDVLAALIRRSDVVVHNYTPRGAASLGLDAPTLAGIHPTVSSVAMTGYGETGPMSSHSSWGPILEAFSGFDEASGYRGEGPMRMGFALPDAVGGVHGAFAILAALWEREVTGAAVHVDLSQLETLLAIAGESLLAASVHGSDPPRRGNRSPDVAPQGVYRCAGDDSWVALTVRSDQEWSAIVAAVGDELSSFAELSTAQRIDRHDVIDDAISRWTGPRPAAEAAAALQAAGVPACPVFTNGDLVDSDHLAHRGFIVAWDQPDVGVQRFPGFPIHFGSRDVRLGPAPPLGAHNDEVLRSLGYDAETVRDLERQETIASAPPRTDRAPAAADQGGR